MFGPLSLRLCSLAVMAPALTETANQARVNLSSAPPESGLESRVDAKEYITKVEGDDYYKFSTAPDTIESLSGKKVQSRNFLATFTSTRLTQLGSLKNLPELFKAKHCNSEFVVNGRMNHSATANGKMVSDVDSHAVKLASDGAKQSNGHLSVSEQSDRPDAVNKDTGDQESVQSETSNMDVQCSDSNECVPTDSSEGNSEGRVLRCRPPDPTVSIDTTRRQQTLERRAGRLARRIRRLQSVQATSHVRSQLRGFVDSQHKNLESMATSIKVPTSTDIKPDVLQSEDIKNLSTAALVNLVRRLQSSQVTLRQRLQASSQVDGNSVLTLDDDTASDVEHAAGKLRTNLSHLEKGIDSDATESSSGGESCDEDDYSDTDNKYTPPL